MTWSAASGDEDLVTASRAGNREAFGQIVARYQTLLCSLAYSATGNISQSEDLAQETFITAWKHLAEIREPAKLRGWLCGVARNLINNWLRAQGREPSHQAEPLDAIADSSSSEPLPVDRAISREEAEILWRSLERIPETYRLPLVLFYREHQSVQAVARNLELSEETVRQRLSRGRKLLQEEVLGFVEIALASTSPGKAFTLGVVAALPGMVISAQAASVGVAAAKGGAGAKGLFTLSALSGFLVMLGAVIFSWKTAVDDTKSPRERQFMIRMGWIQISLLLVSLTVGIYLLPQLAARPLTMGIVLALLVLANIIGGVVMTDYLNRQRLLIGMEEGTLADCSGLEAATERQARLRTVKIMIPFLMMFGVGSIGLPWSQHWLRCAAVVAVESLVMVWAYRRFRNLQNFQVQIRLPASKLQSVLRSPVVLFPAIIFASALVGGLLPIFLSPGRFKPEMISGPLLHTLGVGLAGAALAYAVFAGVYVWKRKAGAGPEAAVDKTYAQLFQQLNLGPDQRAQLKELVLKKTYAQVRHTMSLMHGKCDAAQRADLISQLKTETESFNSQIKQSLSEEHYREFQAYEKSVLDRTMIDLFRTKSAGTPRELSAEQAERLVHALAEVRKGFPWTTDLSRRDLVTCDYVAAFAEANIDTFAREEEQFEQEFRAQALQILRPDQLAAFTDFQKRQRQSQINGYRMVAKIFSRKGR
jgi:RNA polymerase sigma factor (sigma-70 family)